LPGFEVLEEIGAGGMGVVFKARQTALKRIVAIKMIRAGVHAGRRELARFRYEAEAVAQLQHPNIVQVFSVGEWEGQPYLVLEYLEGGSLSRWIGGQPQAPGTAAELVQKLSRAVHYAHGRGILHRDLKPANVLLTAEGEPKIADFGLAHPVDGHGLTEGPGILGSPSYMAPEQAWGGSRIRDVSTAVDVYALGTVLYELLTGGPPFKGGSSRETLEKVWRERPAPPHALVPGVPIDLETICLKCLEKQPENRYADAAALADDLHRWRKGEPIRARPVGLGGRAWSWCRRNPVVASLLASLVAAIIAGSAGVTIKYIEAREQREAATIESRRARKAESEARQAEKLAVAQKRRASFLLYVSLVQAADRDYAAHNLEAAQRSLDLAGQGDPDWRGFEWHLLHRKLHSELATWNVGWGEPWDMAYSPDGGAVAVITGRSLGEAFIVDAETGRRRFKLSGHEGEPLCIAYGGKDGQVIVTGGKDATARLWSSKDGVALAVISTGHETVEDVAITADGNRLVCAHGDTAITVWNIETVDAPRLLYTFAGHQRRYPHRDDLKDLWTHTHVAVSPDGARAASCADHGLAKRGGLFGGLAAANTCDVLVWNLADGTETAAITDVKVEHINDLAFNARGDLLAGAGADGAIHAWDLPGGKPHQKRTGHTGPVTGLAFLGDGNRLVSSSWDMTLRVWNMADDQLPALYVRPAHADRVTSVAVSPDGRRVASGANREVKIWQLSENPDVVAIRPPGGKGLVAQFVPGKACELVTGGGDGALRFWQADRAVGMGSLRLGQAITALALSRDGTQLAAAAGGRVAVVDVAGRRVLRWYDGHAARIPANQPVRMTAIRSLAFSDDGALIASADGNVISGGEVHLWRSADAVSLWRREVQAPEPTPQPGSTALPLSSRLVPRRVVFASDGTSLLVFGSVHLALRRDAAVLDLRDGAYQRSLPGRYDFAADVKGHVTVWALQEDDLYQLALHDGASRQPRQIISQQSRQTYALALAPDGSRLAAATENRYGTSRGDLRLFDTRTGVQTLNIEGIGSDVDGLAFSPSGHHLAAVCSDGIVRIYNAAP
jgi:WD40 repeat protein